MKTKALHWADIYAEKIIREKGEKDLYVCASGITPSGTVHIGNFREIISVDLVVRALRERGKKVRFIYSWDDYDVFRKVPANMPNREMLEEFLRKPITLTPDPTGTEQSYARKNEREIESLLPLVGINPEYLYQAEAYRVSTYAEEIREAIRNKQRIREILNEHRTSPLPEDWWPISVFCSACHKDTTGITGWDGDFLVSYLCRACGHREEADLRRTSSVKLLWRIDWPMRWAHEKVDFEPAGKDHHSEGGSFDTARKIVREVYHFEAPTSFQYDFIGIKGRGGKISSSAGEVVSLKEVLEIYQPEVVRYLFASTRPNTEFSISFDLDVIKIYEDYDRCERIYYGLEPVSEKKAGREKRVYELSQVGETPDKMPAQVPFRHLSNLLQIHGGDIEKVFRFLDIKSSDLEPLTPRAGCAWNWINRFAPEDFCFALRTPKSPALKVSEQERKALSRFREDIDKNLETHDEKSLSEVIYRTAREAGLEPKEFFKLLYRVLIDREKGPRLAGFILTLGRVRVMELLSAY